MKFSMTAAHRWCAVLQVTAMTRMTINRDLFSPGADGAGTAAAEASSVETAQDRGDVPGWVMITMMTAIVVIVLLGVFQEAVVTAVKNAFDSISGAGMAPGGAGGDATP